MNWYSNLLERDHRRDTAIEIALTRFQKKVSRSLIHESLTGAIAEMGDVFVVRVCFGHDIKPPRRKWYAVNIADETAEPLTFDDVRQYGELYWR